MGKYWEFRNQILATAIATVGSFGTGTVFGWSAVASDDILQRNEFPGITKENEISWITSVAILGAFLAGPLAGFLMDRVGRKTALLIFSIPFILGWTIICSAYFTQPHAFFLIYIGRILTGICAGACLVIVPTYINEIAADHLRGILGSSMPLMLVTGILYTFMIGSYFHWAVMSACCGVIPVVLACGCFVIPETPRFLSVKNNKAGSIKSYKWLNAIDSNSNAIADEVVPSYSGSTIGNTRKRNWRTLLSRPVALPVFIILWVIFFQQFGGVNVVTLYTIDIFREAGGVNPHLATMILGVVQIVFVLLSMILVDVLGRKTLLVCCNFIMGLNLMMLGGYFYLKENGNGCEKLFTLLPVLVSYGYIAAYSCGAGSVAWVLASEIYNPDYRAESATIMTSSYWIFGFIVAKTYDSLKAMLQTSGSFFLYGGCCLGGAVFAALFVPETKGKSSEEIMKYFGATKEVTEPFRINSSSCDENCDTINSTEPMLPPRVEQQLSYSDDVTGKNNSNNA